ncbi:hypothetical protein KY285_019701 [Solanum tuberosum]|nr:hypothetical protein KY284_019710 [Solanum tuberosum]KAH0692604.1 hypothetical protein KY285_019701 [Solanum tuberosum]
MHNQNQEYEDMMFNEEDQDTEDQVVPQMPLETPLSLYEPSCHISNERRGTKHARSSYSNPLLEEPIDFGHAPKYRKEIPSQSATSSKDNIHYNMALQLTDSLKICSYNHSNFEGETSNGWGEPNQAGFKCEPGNVVNAKRELQLTGRYNDEDATLEL